MKILLVTQNEPFYLAESFQNLLDKLPEGAVLSDAIILPASPFGKKLSFFQRAMHTRAIFGNRFFMRYAIRFLVRKIGRSPSVEDALRKYGVKTHRIVGSINSAENLQFIRSLDADVLLSVAGNQIFKRPLLDIPKICSLNLHTALLPKYRGLMPSFWVIRNQESETGVSVFMIDEGIDSGPILVQKRMSIEGMSQETLIRDSKLLGMTAICEAMEKILAGDMTTIDNPEDQATYFSFPTREDVLEFRRAGGRFF